MNRKSTLKIIGLGILSALLAGCGTQVTPRAGTELYSGSGPSIATPPTTSPNGDGVAECLSFDSTSVRLAGKATTYYYNGSLREDMMRMRITSLVAEYDTNPNYYLQFFRWRMLNGTADLDSNPLQFRFEMGNGSRDPISADLTSIQASTLARIRTDKNLGGTTAVDFFSKTTLVLLGVNFDWQAVKAVIYDGSTSPSKIVGEIDILIPAVQANPNRYMLSHAAPLSQLHPFWNQRTQSLTEAEWTNRAFSSCF